MPRSNNVSFLHAAQGKRHHDMLARTLRTVEDLLASGEHLTYTRVAATAGVSRAWLYRESSARQAIDQAMAKIRPRPRPDLSPTRQSDASKDVRIRNLLEDNRRLRDEVQSLRTRLGELLGEIRELQHSRGAMA
jgi:hypothetical protein